MCIAIIYCCSSILNWHNTFDEFIKLLHIIYTFSLDEINCSIQIPSLYTKLGVNFCETNNT